MWLLLLVDYGVLILMLFNTEIYATFTSFLGKTNNLERIFIYIFLSFMVLNNIYKHIFGYYILYRIEHC